MELTDEQVRVLCCLVEKQQTTPEQYPLSSNGLRAACNQRTNRHPVVDYDETTVDQAVLGLREAGLARSQRGGRVWKHRHVLDEALRLDPVAQAALAVLGLRGPQTAAEVRARTERYAAMSAGGGGGEDGDGEDGVDVDRVLAALAAHDPPLVVELARTPGRSQTRWAHLLTGEAATVAEPADAPVADHAGAPAPARAAGPSVADRLTALEERVGRLEDALGVDDGEQPV